MAEQKYLKKIEALFEKSPVVPFSNINRIVQQTNKTDYAKQIVHLLIKKGKIKRITKGYYTRFDEIGLSVLCFQPSYLGLHSALSFHGLWEQETIPVIVTSRTVRQGIRKCMGANILIRRSCKAYIFGYEYVNDSGYYLPYSDIEKTFIDFFVFREKLSPETMQQFERKINLKKLQRYLLRYPKRIRIKVLHALRQQGKKLR